MERLHVPSVSHEARRQVVEQLRVRRQASLAAEVFLRRNDALAKVHPPDAIDRDSRRERVLRVRQPVRKSETVAGPIGRKRWQACRGVGSYDFPWRVVGAALETDDRGGKCLFVGVIGMRERGRAERGNHGQSQGENPRESSKPPHAC